MAERYFQHQFPNGLTLLGEVMPAVQSAAMALLVPAGADSDPMGQSGAATVVSDLVFRGAGQRNSHELSDFLDSLGLQRGSGVGTHHTHFTAAALAGNVLSGLTAYADIVQRAHLAEGEFACARELAMQSLAGLEDEPRQKLLVKLREWHLPSPLGRNPMGTAPELEKLSAADARAAYAQRYQPQGAILALAGAIDFPRVRDLVEQHFGAWKPGAPEAIKLTPPSGRVHHEHQPSEQTHIGLAYPSIPETHEDYYTVRVAMEILSGGMSGRLFTEVREKRGLCYSVWAGYYSLRGMASILGYAGTSNDRAQATLDCFIEELQRFCSGVTADELQRAKVGLMASTIMQGESTSARAGAIAHDYFVRRRIRTLDEIKNAIESVTLQRVNEFLSNHPPGPFTIVTVGPKELQIPS